MFLSSNSFSLFLGNERNECYHKKYESSIISTETDNEVM